MKNFIKVFALAVLLVAVQACGTKIEKSTEAETAVEANQKTALSAAEERRATLLKDAAVLLEKRKLEQAKLVHTSPTYVDLQGGVVYRKAEVDPSFIGGDDAMMKFLRDNVVFPKQAEKDELEGTVFVDFIIGSDGVVREIEVTDATSTAVDQSFRNEAVRVVASMPRWSPGRQNDKPVNVKYSIPITFQMI